MPLALKPPNPKGTYHLNLKPPKTSVFVTQLNDQQDCEDDIRRFPVVKESSDEILKGGINTLQKTSLLRKTVEVKLVDRQLAAKREEFTERMAISKSKEELLRRRQEELNVRMEKFDRFLKENESKRNRALKKYQKELKENQLRSEELDRMREELEDLQEVKCTFVRRLAYNKKFADFMGRVVDVLPEGYVEMTEETMSESIIRRHEALVAMHRDLLKRNRDCFTVIESGHRKMELMRQERSQARILITQELAELQNYYETVTERSKALEQKVGELNKRHHATASGLGRVTMAIDNISIACHNRYWPSLLTMSYTDKLSMIKQHLLYREQVRKLAQNLTDVEAVSSSIKLFSQSSKVSVLSDPFKAPSEKSNTDLGRPSHVKALPPL